jgi:hypothetical protein
MTRTKSTACRLAAGAFKRDAIPKSVGTVKKSTLFMLMPISYHIGTSLCSFFFVNQQVVARMVEH